MKGTLFVLAIVSMALWGVSAQANLITNGDFESGGAGWTRNFGTVDPVYDAAPDPKGLSFKMPDGVGIRIGQDFDNTGLATVGMTFAFYTNDVSTSTQRYGVGFAANGAGSVNGATVRIASYNLANYQVMYWTGSWNYVDTGVKLGVGWHVGELKLSPDADLIEWKLDDKSGSITDTSLLMPGGVNIGFNATNGAAGAPDTSAWFDNIVVDVPEPAALIMLGLGSLLFARRRRTA